MRDFFRFIIQLMFILGKSNDDKGAQLEKLAVSMLEDKGYTRIRVNTVGSGASEYDLTAVYVIPGLGDNPVEIAVMGECKARQAAVSMDDWQKFIGKVYLEKLRTSRTLYGLYFTTSGVKSTVQSSADDLSRDYDGLKVDLIAAAKIEDFLRSKYKIKNLRETVNDLAPLTTREVVSLDLCYYDNRCYQLVRFGNTYSLLAARGEPLTGQSLEDVKKLLESTDEVNIGELTFIDLQEEAEAKERSLLVQKHVLARLMLYSGVCTFADLINETPFDDSEIRKAVALNKNKGWLEIQEDVVSLKGVDEAGACMHFVDIVKFWLCDNKWHEKPLKEMLFSQFYHEQINENLLDVVLGIQANLPVPEADRVKLIQILRLSPSALATALNPIHMITYERHLHGMRDDERINSTDLNLFYEKIIGCARHDFNIIGLEDHILNYQGFFELEENLILRRIDETEFELRSKSRHRIHTSNTSTGYLRVIPIAGDEETKNKPESED